MEYFVVLTTECNLQCSYCYGKAFFDSPRETKEQACGFVPEEMRYRVKDLADFCKRDRECGIIFYGGEPLLRMEKFEEILENVNAKSFILQTNATMLDKVKPRHLKKLNGIQVSVDGDEETTDACRGKGTYKKCVENSGLVKEKGFEGELIARMTVTEKTGIFEQVMHLLNLELFDAVHWQLDAQFGYDYGGRDFSKWVEESYNPGITRLVDKWLEEMERGKVLRLYPFLGVMESLLKKEKWNLRCGAGWAHYVIQTNGKLVPCPAMQGMKNFYAGTLKTRPSDLKKFGLGEPCDKCSIREKCGGRCLYANETKNWGEKGFEEVCVTARHLVEEMEKALPKVKKLMGEGKVREQDFEYTKFNSCEIIP